MNKGKRIKQVRKIIKFYRINYDFHQPYSVIIDGNFVQSCLKKQYNIKYKMEKLMKGHCIFFTTSCILNELLLLGSDLQDAFLECKKLEKIKCKHEVPINPSECIKSVVGQKSNDKKYMICSNDFSLKKAFAKADYILPFFYFDNGKFNIDSPRNNTVIKNNLIHSNDDLDVSKYLPMEHEVKAVQEHQREQKEKLFIKKKEKFQKEVALSGSQLRKKALGPNPLSLKKKKKAIYSQSGEHEHIKTDQTKIVKNNENAIMNMSTKQKRCRKRKQKLTLQSQNHNNS